MCAWHGSLEVINVTHISLDLLTTSPQPTWRGTTAHQPFPWLPEEEAQPLSLSAQALPAQR